MGLLDKIGNKGTPAAAAPAARPAGGPFAKSAAPAAPATPPAPAKPAAAAPAPATSAKPAAAPAPAAAPKSGPFAKAQPAAPAATPAAETPAAAPTGAPARVNPFEKKAAAAKPVETPTETPTVADPVLADIADAASEALNMAAENPETAKAIVEAAEAATGKTEVTVETKTEQPAETTQKNKKNNGKKNNAKSEPAPKVEKSTEVNDSMEEMPTTDMSYADAVLNIQSQFVDEEWNKMRDEIEQRMSDIVISSDMNAGTLKSVIGKIHALRDDIWSDYSKIKSLYESLSSKEPEGLIERVKKINLGDGSNDLQRKKAGVEACMRYQSRDGSGIINLYEFLDETRTRYNFLKTVMDSLTYKQEVLITMSSAIKQEGK